MPVSSLSKPTIEGIKENLKNCQRFIQKNKNNKIDIFWDDSFLDAVPFSDLSIEASKSEREFFINLCENTINNMKSSNDTQAIS